MTDRTPPRRQRPGDPSRDRQRPSIDGDRRPDRSRRPEPVAARGLGGDGHEADWDVDDSPPRPPRRQGQGRGAAEPAIPQAHGRERLAPVRFRPGRRRRWPRRLLIIANLIVGLVIISGAAAYGYFNLRLGQISRTHFSDLANVGGGQPFTMLLVGSDSRNISGGSQFAGGNSPTSEGQRSDTIILARIVPAARQITLMSIPRDLWVPIQGLGSNRVNAAFNSGPQLLVSTIQNDLKIPISHYAEVNFDTFRDIANAVGGVHVWFPTRARDLYSNLQAGAGCDLLNGDGALAFVRSRHYEYYADGYWHPEAASDLAREKRQQYFLKRLADKAKTEYTNPFALNSIVSSITKNLVVDDKLSTSDILALARTFRGIGSSNIPSLTLPTKESMIEGNDVLTLDQPAARQAIAAFNAIGTTPPKTTTTRPATPASPPANAPRPSSVAVEVVNGSGSTGQAAKASSDLQRLGYQTTTVTNTRAYVGSSNVIRYAPDSQAAAQALATKLSGGAQLVADPSLSPTSFNVELITGSGYAGLGNGQASTATTAPPATAPPSAPANSPASSSSADTASVAQYTLPGTPPGATPPASCAP